MNDPDVHTHLFQDEINTSGYFPTDTAAAIVNQVQEVMVEFVDFFQLLMVPVDNDEEAAAHLNDVAVRFR